MNRELGQSMTKASDLERNPFRPGMGLEPLYLADRQYQLQRFARYLDGFPEFPRNVRVIGLRGVATRSTAIRQRPVLSDQLFSASRLHAAPPPQRDAGA